jgi:hypothetical protein
MMLPLIGAVLVLLAWLAWRDRSVAPRLRG